MWKRRMNKNPDFCLDKNEKQHSHKQKSKVEEISKLHAPLTYTKKRIQNKYSSIQRIQGCRSRSSDE